MGMSSKQVSSDHLELNWTQNMLTTSETTTTTILQSSSNPRSTNTKRSSLHTQQQQPDTLKCPRCDSSNTKFCYYNNYNKTQPRHYCKACKRHWTKGGTLRNVPVGGGRKNKRIKRPANNVNNTATIDHNNLELFGDHQKYIFPQDNINKGFLFKQPIIGTTTSSEFDQVSWDFNGGFATSMQQQNLGFSIHSSLTSMDTNTTIIPTSSYSPLLLSGFKDDSTVTTTSRMMTPNSSNNVVSTQPWMMQAPTPISNILEPNNFWTWNDIDYMVQGDHNINKPFDEGPHTMKH